MAPGPEEPPLLKQPGALLRLACLAGALLLIGTCISFPGLPTDAFHKAWPWRPEKAPPLRRLLLGWCGVDKSRTRNRPWTTNLDKILQGRLDASSAEMSPQHGPPHKHLHEAFACRWTPPDIALPFQWFCHPAGEGVTLEGPDGPIPLEPLGQVFGLGPHLYHFNVTKSGPTKIRFEGKEARHFNAKREECSCPQPLQDFRKAYTCSAEDLERLDQMLGWWPPQSVTREIFNATLLRTYGHFTHFAIIDNEIYVRQAGKPGPWSHYWPQLTGILKSVVRKVKLPDVEFYIHPHDMPFLDRMRVGSPVFAFCSDTMHRDVLFPSPEHIAEAFSGAMLRLSARGKPWEERIPKAYFRGSNTGFLPVVHGYQTYMHHRFRAARFAKQHPDLFDVLVLATRTDILSASVQKQALEEKIASLAKRESKVAGMQYKYVLDLDGFTAPFRTSGLMAIGSLVVKHKSPYFEYFYNAMVPGVHYMEVEESLRDLVEVVKWAAEHDEDAKAIAERGVAFFSERLRQEDIICWVGTALHKVREGLAFKPEIAPDMEKLENDSPSDCEC